jgi:hypothetical protein
LSNHEEMAAEADRCCRRIEALDHGGVRGWYRQTFTIWCKEKFVDENERLLNILEDNKNGECVRDGRGLIRKNVAKYTRRIWKISI